MTDTKSTADGERLQARCLCGAVRFSAVPANANTSVCHCHMCQRWAAGPFFGVHCRDTVEFETSDDLERFESSQWAERGFCRKCGTSLFWNLRGKADYHVSLTAFEPRPDAKFTDEIFIDEKPDCYAFANDTKKLTGAQVFAMFAEGQE
ncbi:GFA family protein [Nitratireductor sp. XY-223]|uniref:GFA family protein n=1 Tax=Nitratireductor sp. XY-223 TaxID=2561926 RepID=UPI0010AA42D6|nr:GFA family protein [Nitratireductor sp. XY-223]